MSQDNLAMLEPVSTLLERLGAELSADFGAGPIRISRAPGRLDVMGGIADYTGSLVCEATLNQAAAVALSPRTDRELQAFSFNLYDDHLPFTFRIPLEALAGQPASALSRELNEPGRKWAGYLAGCLFLLQERGLIDLQDERVRGMNLAVFSTVPSGAGVSSSAALEVATMLNLMDHFAIPRQSVGPMKVAAMCQEVENRIVGAPCGIMDQVSSCLGEAGALLRLRCQPHELEAPLPIPHGIRFVGINSGVKHSVGGGQYGRTRCAAFMGHKIILDLMRRMGTAAGQTLVADPMNGYLANLDPDDYKRFFRPYIPERLKGGEFLLKYGPTIDKATTVEPDCVYAVQQAVDHHVLEARRVKNFAEYLEQAAAAPPGTRERGSPLDRAGHLMYASHISYTNDALLGAPECDLLVKLVRDREPAGFYGAKITGGGSGGTVAVLADDSPRADTAIAEILSVYEGETGRRATLLAGSSPGGWNVGTQVIG